MKRIEGIETYVHGIEFMGEAAMRAAVAYAIGYFGAADTVAGNAAAEKLTDALAAMYAHQKDKANRK